MNNVSISVPSHEDMRECLEKMLKATGRPTKESQRAKLASDLKWKFSRVTELSLGRAKPKVEELVRVGLLTKPKDKDDALLERLDNLERQIGRLVERLSQSDPDFHEPQINAHRSVVTRARNSIEGKGK